jgi:hypothetical protein
MLQFMEDPEAKSHRGPKLFSNSAHKYLAPRWLPSLLSPLPVFTSKAARLPACNESSTITHKFLPSSRQQLLFSKSPSMLYCFEVSHHFTIFLLFSLLSSQSNLHLETGSIINNAPKDKSRTSKVEM